MPYIYRPHKGDLMDALKERKVFATAEELKEYVAKEEFNLSSFHVEPKDIILDTTERKFKDERIGWLDVGLVCIVAYEDVIDKEGYLRYYGEAYSHTCAIGWYATKFPERAFVDFGDGVTYLE